MKKNPSELLRKAQAPVLVASVLMPPTLAAFALLVPERMTLLWLLPLAYLIAAEGCLLVPGKHRVLFTSVGAILLTGLCAIICALTQCWWLMFASILYSAALLAVMPAGGWSWHEELPPLFFYLGIGLFLAVQIFAGMIRELFPLFPDRISNGMSISFLVFAALALLSMNRHTLNAATSRRHKASANVRRKNGIMVLVFFLLVTLIVATPAILQTIGSAVLWIVRRIVELIDLLRGDDKVTTFPIETIVPTEPNDVMMGGETTSFAELMKKVFKVVSNVFFAVSIPVLLLFLLGKAGKLLRKLKKLAEKWNRFLAASSEDYEEEITDIRDKDSEKRIKGRSGKRVSASEERKMTPKERIRYRYGRMLRKHPEWAESHTAREKLPEETASLYEKARYSYADLTEEDAKQFASSSKRI